MNEEVTVRTMTIADYEKVYELWMSCKNMGLKCYNKVVTGVANEI